MGSDDSDIETHTFGFLLCRQPWPVSYTFERLPWYSSLSWSLMFERYTAKCCPPHGGAHINLLLQLPELNIL